MKHYLITTDVQSGDDEYTLHYTAKRNDYTMRDFVEDMYVPSPDSWVDDEGNILTQAEKEKRIDEILEGYESDGITSHYGDKLYADVTIKEITDEEYSVLKKFSI